jgi:hypothetical protein
MLYETKLPRCYYKFLFISVRSSIYRKLPLLRPNLRHCNVIAKVVIGGLEASEINSLLQVVVWLKNTLYKIPHKLIISNKLYPINYIQWIIIENIIKQYQLTCHSYNACHQISYLQFFVQLFGV